MRDLGSRDTVYWRGEGTALVPRPFDIVIEIGTFIKIILQERERERVSRANTRELQEGGSNRSTRRILTTISPLLATVCRKRGR